MLTSSEISNILTDGNSLGNNSKEYKENLSKRKLESETVPLKPYSCFRDQDIFEINDWYIDKAVFDGIETLLTNYGLQEHLNQISVIVKNAYRQKILNEINQTERDYSKFLGDLLELYKKLTYQSYDTVEFSGPKDKQAITDERLVTFVVEQLKPLLFNRSTSFLLAGHILKGSNENRRINYETNNFLFDITYYLYTFTKFFQDVDIQTLIEQPRLTNDQSRFYSSIMVLSQIESDDSVELQAIRTKVTRFLKNNRSLYNCCNNNHDSTETFFEDISELNQLIEIANKINRHEDIK